MTNTPEYQRDYERKRKIRCRAAGLCVVGCGRKRRPGLAQNGRPFSRCPRCIDRQARNSTASRLRRRRRGFCTNCPRKMPKGDKHWNCPPCRQLQRKRGAAYYLRHKEAA